MHAVRETARMQARSDSGFRDLLILRQRAGHAALGVGAHAALGVGAGLDEILGAPVGTGRGAADLDRLAAALLGGEAEGALDLVRILDGTQLLGLLDLGDLQVRCLHLELEDRKSTRLNSSHSQISYAVFCLKKKKNN